MIDDQQLEVRLRRIAAGPRPPVPDAIDSFLDDLTAHRPRRQIAVLPGLARPSFVAKTRAFAGVAATIVLSVTLAGLAVSVRSQPVAPVLWTGLEWHDVTTQMPVGYFPLVAWNGGFATTDAEGVVWLSPEGLTWRKAAGAPPASLTSMAGGLIGLRTELAPCPPDAAGPCHYPGGHPMVSRDGAHWTEASELPAAPLPDRSSDPFDMKFRLGLVGDTRRALYATPAGVYVTADGVEWRHAPLPDDMANALQLQFLLQEPSGFVATGFAQDPNGTGTRSMTSDSGLKVTYRGDNALWESADGLSWVRRGPGADNVDNRWKGSAGIVRWDAAGVQHSDDGVVWTKDRSIDQNAFQFNGFEVYRIASSGDRIVAVAFGPTPRLWVTTGDGEWRQLQLSGDLGEGAWGGFMQVTGSGVFLFAGRHIYYGQAVAGSVSGSLHVAPSPSPGPPTSSPQPEISLPAPS